MQELMIRPTIYSFDNCRQFAEKFKLGEGDLLFTNKRLFKKFFEPLGLGCDVIFREDYGKGEPTDVMAEAIFPSCLHWRIFLRLRIFMTVCFRL